MKNEKKDEDLPWKLRTYVFFFSLYNAKDVSKCITLI